MNQREMFLLIGGAAATFAFVVAAGELPLFSLPLSLVAALPAAYVHMLAGALPGGLVVIICTALLAVTGSLGEAGSYLFQFGIGSFCLPLLLKKKWAWDRAVGLTLVIVVFASGLLLAGHAFYDKQNIGHLVESYVQVQLDQASRLAQEADLSPEQREEIDFVLATVGDFIRKTYISLALVTNGAILLFILFFLSRVPEAAKEICGVNFRSWSLSPWIVWILIAAGFSFVFSSGSVEVLALNVLVFLLPAYFLQGLAIVAFFFWKKKFAPWLRTLGYALIFTVNPLPLLVTGMGLFDLWIDFRKPRKKKEE